MAKLVYKNALVTGASSGIGRSLVRWFAGRGLHVYAAARRSDRLAELRDEAGAGAVIPVSLDVADAASAMERIRAIDAECGGLDLVVANAGVGAETNVKRFDWDSLEQLVDVNVTGAAATLTAVLPRMVERGRGHLVGISSAAAFRGLPRHAGYSASKAFVAVFLEGLRVDLRRRGVKVTCIYPGFVKSEMTAKNRFKMPFLLETDDAADRIGRAIMRGARTYLFPWQIALLMGVARAAPNALYDSAVPKVV